MACGKDTAATAAAIAMTATPSSASSELRVEKSEEGEQRRAPPRFDLSPLEKVYVVVALSAVVILLIVGVIYYYDQFRKSEKNPVIAYSTRMLSNEEFPVHHMTVIPLISTRFSSSCRVTSPFHLWFGWWDHEDWVKTYVSAEWRLIKNFWIATVELPFKLLFNSNDQFVMFRPNQTCRHVKTLHGSDYTEFPCGGTSRSLPHYGYFDDPGIACDLDPDVPQVSDSGILLQFHNRARNISEELMGTGDNAGYDPLALLLTTFTDAVVYEFKPKDHLNFIVRLKALETTSAQGDKTVKLHNYGTRLPYTAGFPYWRTGVRHYLSVVADRSAHVVKEQVQLTAVGAVTAFATSITTILGIFGLLFTTQVSVPFHFAFGKRSLKYQRHIVYGGDSDSESSETSAGELEAIQLDARRRLSTMTKRLSG